MPPQSSIITNSSSRPQIRYIHTTSSWSDALHVPDMGFTKFLWTVTVAVQLDLPTALLRQTWALARRGIVFSGIGETGSRQALSESRTSVQLMATSLLLILVGWSIIAQTRVFQRDLRRRTLRLSNFSTFGNRQQWKKFGTSTSKVVTGFRRLVFSSLESLEKKKLAPRPPTFSILFSDLSTFFQNFCEKPF